MLRPQPIGIFPPPANYLLISESAKDFAEYQNLLSGILPKEDSFYKFAIEGDKEKAFTALPDDDLPETRFNRFVLDPSPGAYHQLKNDLTGEFGSLLELVAFTLNYISEPPGDKGLDCELLAFVFLAQALHKIETGEIETAIALLKESAEAAKPVSPMFYGQIMTSLAETRHQFFGADAHVAQIYKTALDALKKSELESKKAAINMNLGICYQEMSAGSREPLLEAVKCYQKALKFFTQRDFAEEFAFLQNNLALAHLSIPMTEASDQLRAAIAIQALREALKVYRQETHGELWASTQLNLAKALQYAPASHAEENLQEAVNLYEEVLSVRRPTENPIGYARLLENQGKALAHLGIFKQAVPKLVEARNIFNQIGEAGPAESINEVLAEIENNQSDGDAL
jgi:tetratricopeptide (TPR) repeat protein